MPARSKLKWTLLLPVALAVWCARSLKRAVVRPRSEKAIRDAERTHQSQVRRQLRGLPADHDQADFHTDDTAAKAS